MATVTLGEKRTISESDRQSAINAYYGSKLTQTRQLTPQQHQQALEAHYGKGSYTPPQPAPAQQVIPTTSTATSQREPPTLQTPGGTYGKFTPYVTQARAEHAQEIRAGIIAPNPIERAVIGMDIQAHQAELARQTQAIQETGYNPFTQQSVGTGQRMSMGEQGQNMLIEAANKNIAYINPKVERYNLLTSAGNRAAASANFKDNMASIKKYNAQVRQTALAEASEGKQAAEALYWFEREGKPRDFMSLMGLTTYKMDTSLTPQGTPMYTFTPDRFTGDWGAAGLKALDIGIHAVTAVTTLGIANLAEQGYAKMQASQPPPTETFKIYQTQKPTSLMTGTAMSAKGDKPWAITSQKPEVLYSFSPRQQAQGNIDIAKIVGFTVGAAGAPIITSGVKTAGKIGVEAASKEARMASFSASLKVEKLDNTLKGLVEEVHYRAAGKPSEIEMGYLNPTKSGKRYNLELETFSTKGKTVIPEDMLGNTKLDTYKINPKPNEAKAPSIILSDTTPKGKGLGNIITPEELNKATGELEFTGKIYNAFEEPPSIILKGDKAYPFTPNKRMAINPLELEGYHTRMKPAPEGLIRITAKERTGTYNLWKGLKETAGARAANTRANLKGLFQEFKESQRGSLGRQLTQQQMERTQYPDMLSSSGWENLGNGRQGALLQPSLGMSASPMNAMRAGGMAGGIQILKPHAGYGIEPPRTEWGFESGFGGKTKQGNANPLEPQERNKRLTGIIFPKQDFKRGVGTGSLYLSDTLLKSGTAQGSMTGQKSMEGTLTLTATVQQPLMKETTLYEPYKETDLISKPKPPKDETPYIPLPTLPDLNLGGGGQSRGWGFGDIMGKQKKKYTPSIAAQLTGKTVSRTPRGLWAGIEIRPMVVYASKKKKKR